jgi:hypothetical protein
LCTNRVQSLNRGEASKQQAETSAADVAALTSQLATMKDAAAVAAATHTAELDSSKVSSSAATIHMCTGSRIL